MKPVADTGAGAGVVVRWREPCLAKEGGIARPRGGKCPNKSPIKPVSEVSRRSSYSAVNRMSAAEGRAA